MGYRSWVFSYLRQYKFLTLVSVISVLFWIYMRTLIPVLLGNLIIDQILLDINGIYSEIGQQMNALLQGISLIIVVSLASVFFYIVSAISNSLIAWILDRDIRKDFFDSIQSKPLTFHDKIQAGEIMALATNDIGQINRMTTDGVRMSVDVFVTLIIVAILALTAQMNIILSLAAMCFLPLYLWAIYIFGKRLGPISEVFNRRYANMAATLQGNLEGVSVIRAFGAEEFERKKFRKVITDFRDTWERRQYIMAKYYPSLILYFVIGLSFALGVYLSVIGVLSIGSVIAFDGVLATLILPTQSIAFAISRVQSGFAGAYRVYNSMFSEEREESEIERSKKIPWSEEIKGEIEFKNVFFSYNKSPVFSKRNFVFKDISFKIHPGETVAIVGPTGSGKTTLTNILLRLYEIDSGTISIDGINIQNFTLEDLRKNIGRIEQDVFLYATTIRKNIAFGKPDATEEQIQHVAKLAQAHEFIDAMENKYETEIGERGVKLSGGQRQRLAIARTFLTDPKILILDDSTSSIDSQTEEKIVRAIDALLYGRTSFIITHRLSTIRQADKIIVLKDGNIAAMGTHKELITTSEAYRRIYGRRADLPPLVPSPNLVKPTRQEG